MRTLLTILFVSLSLAGCDVAHGAAPLELNVQAGRARSSR